MLKLDAGIFLIILKSYVYFIKKGINRLCHIVVIIIDIFCNIWQQVLYHIVVLEYLGRI